jgi:hypothetical protein
MRPETRAQHVVEAYGREIGGAEAILRPARLGELITDAIQKAMTEDREALRDRMPCATGDPCAFELCAHHKALVAAVMSIQEGTSPPPRSPFSRPLSS